MTMRWEPLASIGAYLVVGAMFYGMYLLDKDKVYVENTYAPDATSDWMDRHPGITAVSLYLFLILNTGGLLEFHASKESVLAYFNTFGGKAWKLKLLADVVMLILVALCYILLCFGGNNKPSIKEFIKIVAIGIPLGIVYACATNRLGSEDDMEGAKWSEICEKRGLKYGKVYFDKSFHKKNWSLKSACGRVVDYHFVEVPE